MAKSKPPKAKSSSATIGFEQQIWAAACELWGHILAGQKLQRQPTHRKSAQF